MSAPEDIVVTGAGVVCNMGDDLAEITAMLRRGENKPFDVWEPAVEAGAKCHLLGVYHGDVSDDALGISKSEGRFMGRSPRLALKASRAALAQSGRATDDLAVVFGSGTGDVDTHREIQARLDKGFAKVAPTVIPRLMGSTVSANLVNVLHTQGPSFSVTAACAAGAYNVLLAATLLRSGHVDAALAGGVEMNDLHFYVGFDSMRAYTRTDNDRPDKASRPYAADRSGFVFAEGAGALVLERRADAEARGAEVLGTVLGWGMSSDGEGKMVAPSSEGAARAMRSALKHAGVEPGAIGYVNTHGTSTPVGDVTEVEAIRSCFEGRHVAYSSTKGYTGHTVSGAGAIEAIFTMAMLREGWLAPCVNVDTLDEKLVDYPPLLEPTDARVELALSNSFGFGGTNVTLVLSRSYSV